MRYYHLWNYLMNGVIAGANDIIRKLDGNVQYNTVEEFKSFLDSDDVDEF